MKKLNTKKRLLQIGFLILGLFSILSILISGTGIKEAANSPVPNRGQNTQVMVSTSPRKPSKDDEEEDTKPPPQPFLGEPPPVDKPTAKLTALKHEENRQNLEDGKVIAEATSHTLSDLKNLWRRMRRKQRANSEKPAK